MNKKMDIDADKKYDNTNIPYIDWPKIIIGIIIMAAILIIARLKLYN